MPGVARLCGYLGGAVALYRGGGARGSCQLTRRGEAPPALAAYGEGVLNPREPCVNPTSPRPRVSHLQGTAENGDHSCRRLGLPELSPSSPGSRCDPPFTSHGHITRQEEGAMGQGWIWRRRGRGSQNSLQNYCGLLKRVPAFPLPPSLHPCSVHALCGFPSGTAVSRHGAGATPGGHQSVAGDRHTSYRPLYPAAAHSPPVLPQLSPGGPGVLRDLHSG